MIVGTGDIAKTLIEEGLDRDDITFFASGVSNSKETQKEEYYREIELFNAQSIYQHIVYFSSLCVYYSDSVYANHKRIMEYKAKEVFQFCTIVRLGNITWGSNPNTIINYFKSLHAAGKAPELKDTYRYLITKPEFIHWMKSIRQGVNDIMNIPGEFIHVNEIWRRVQNGTY